MIFLQKNYLFYFFEYAINKSRHHGGGGKWRMEMTNIGHNSPAVSLADRYAEAKAAYDAAEAALKAIKAEVDATGLDFIEGESCALSVHLSVRKALDEALLMSRFGVTKEQVNSCKVEGNPFPVIKIKAKVA